MIKVVYKSEFLNIAVGVKWFHWYVGAGYTEVDTVRAISLHFGPFLLIFMREEGS